jgi:3-oxoacyl-[acyl-carrier protein] reductase
MRRALVFGGSGTVGAEVVRGLAAAGVPSLFTYHQGRARAEALAAELGQRTAALDLADGAAIRALIAGLDREGAAPDVFIHCAGAFRNAPLAELTDDDWDGAQAINARAPFIACRALAPILARTGGGSIVLVGAVDRTQSLPLPVAFAASQGTLAALTMALAKELGEHGTRVNMVALGLLDRGLSAGLAPALVDDFKRFSALRRTGSPAEAARAIVWLALEAPYLSGKVLPVNGGI